MIRKVALSLVSVAIMAAGSTQAAPVISIGNPNNQGTSNVLFTPCGDGLPATGTTIQGCLNTDHSEIVTFTSGDGLLASGGQNGIDAARNTFNDLTIALADDTLGFSKLIFNIDVANSRARSMGGSVTLLAELASGETFEQAFELRGNGQNFFGIVAAENELIRSLRLVSSLGLAGLNQIRVGSAQLTDSGVDVPAPAAFGLLGMGLLGLVGLRRRGWHVPA